MLKSFRERASFTRSRAEDFSPFFIITALLAILLSVPQQPCSFTRQAETFMTVPTHFRFSLTEHLACLLFKSIRNFKSSCAISVPPSPRSFLGTDHSMKRSLTGEQLSPEVCARQGTGEWMISQEALLLGTQCSKREGRGEWVFPPLKLGDSQPSAWQSKTTTTTTFTTVLGSLGSRPLGLW